MSEFGPDAPEPPKENHLHLIVQMPSGELRVLSSCFGLNLLPDPELKYKAKLSCTTSTWTFVFQCTEIYPF